MQKRSTKRALIASILMLSICITMFVGTSYAWFTDTVTSSGNIIKAGNLQIAMNWAQGSENPTSDTLEWKDAETDAIFTADELWEPGYTTARHIQIANTGSLALKYEMRIMPTVTDAVDTKLAEKIDVYYVNPAQQLNDRTDLQDGWKLGTLADFLAANATTNNTAKGNLAPGDSHTVTIALKMSEDAGNEYQNTSIGTDFAVRLFAAQWTYESDSFDNLYDELAEFEDIPAPVPVPQPSPDDKTVVSDTGLVMVTIPAGSFATDDEFTVQAVGNPRPEPDAEGNYELDLDITLFKNNTAVTPDGTEYYVRIDIGKNLNVTSFTHNGENLAENKWGYNAAEGILWFYTTSFSPFVTKYYQTHTVTFDANGGTGSMATKTIKRGAEATLPANAFTNEGYEFAGWNTDKEGDGAAYANEAKFTAYTDMILYAQWREPAPVPAENYTVTFDSNGGAGTMDTQTIPCNTEAALNANLFTKADHDFAGWNTKADGTGAAYVDGAMYTAYADATLYAQWKESGQAAPVTYTVTFVSGIEGVDNTTQSFAEGTAQNLAQNTFTKAGYTFSGWNTKADGTGTAYTNNASFTATADTTLYAQWTAIPTESVSLNKTSTTLTVGGSETLTATITPAPLGNAAWTSSNDTVAVVDAQGKITAVAKGTANITAAYGDKSATCHVTVNEPPEATMEDMTKAGSIIKMSVRLTNALELDGLPIECTFRSTGTGFETIGYKTYVYMMNMINTPTLNLDTSQNGGRFCYLSFGGELANNLGWNQSDALINFYYGYEYTFFTYSNYWNDSTQTKIMLTGLSINGTEMSLADIFETGTSWYNPYKGLLPNDPEVLNRILQAYW